MTKDNGVGQHRTRMQAGRAEEGLGPNTDIGSRLRALYGAVQDEGVPDQLLDLLEKLDSAEMAQTGSRSKRTGE
ncbi:NepR family anti-sigma factor [Devosia aurantiaca]|nr:NepR family anti-sigma factor [Devosia aurantiaca]